MLACGVLPKLMTGMLQANPEPTGNEETGFVSYVVMRDTSESKNPFQQIMNFLGVCPFPDPIAQVRSEAQV